MRLYIIEAANDHEIKDKVRTELMAPSVEMLPDALQTIGDLDFTVCQTQYIPDLYAYVTLNSRHNTSETRPIALVSEVSK